MNSHLIPVYKEVKDGRTRKKHKLQEIFILIIQVDE